MKVLIVEPYKEPSVVELENSLESLHNDVGGMIEAVYLESDILLLCNEEGKILGLDGNRKLDNGDIIAGTFLVCGTNNEGEMISLNNEQFEKYSERFKNPEQYTLQEVETSIFIEVYGQSAEDEAEI